MTVNFAEKTATITCPSDKSVSRDAVEAALKTGNYGVTSFTESPRAGSGT